MYFWKITELSKITQKYIPKIPAEVASSLLQEA